MTKNCKKTGKSFLRRSLISLDLLCILFLFSCGIQVQISVRLHLPAVELQ